MLLVEELIKTKTKKERQTHINLEEKCIERGGNSTNHKGVLAEYLNTNIPYGIQYPLCHACHNGKCSNPKHLYWGTPKENVEDSISNNTFFSNKRCNGHIQNEKTKEKISKSLKGKPSNNKFGINGTNNNNGKKITKGFRYSRKYKQQWITNGNKNTRIPIDQNIPFGWVKGRTIL